MPYRLAIPQFVVLFVLCIISHNFWFVNRFLKILLTFIVLIFLRFGADEYSAPFRILSVYNIILADNLHSCRIFDITVSLDDI